MVAMSQECYLYLAFDSERERDTFQTLITEYAKKDSENERGLLRESWWQPFYLSSEQLSGYQQLTEHTVTANGFTADESLASVLRKPMWVNPSFYHYMLGDFK